MKKFPLIVFAAVLFLAAPALALDLHAARKEGILGEKHDGYVAVLKQSPEASALAKEINTRRAEEYARISKENGQPAGVVGQIAAEQIIGGLESGAMYQDAKGGWKKR